jgi:RNA polymerase-binding transcription factor DksA
MITQKQLAECKQMLLEKQKTIEKEIQEIAKPSSLDGENVPVYEDLGREFGDDASERENFQRNAIVMRELEEHLRQVKAALARIEDGTYGKSVYSGKEIPLKRLQVYPEAKGLADEEE